jgi:Flp pilus assembly pilin Flp
MVLRPDIEGCSRSAKTNRKEHYRMNQTMKAFIRVREWQKGLSKGQTMTEYALIMAAVAVVVFVTYQTMGNDIGSLVNNINSDLTSSS